MSNKTTQEDSSTVTCPTCGDSFGSEHGAQNHHRVHHRPYFDAKIESEYGVPPGWLLHTLYSVIGNSTRDIADKLGYSKPVVVKHMNRHGIDLRKSNRDKPPHFGTYRNTNGFYYEKWKRHTSEGYIDVYVHRLIAVSEYGFDAVKGMDVHHRNEITWDNRPENIELMGHGEHRSHHATGDD